MNTQKFIETSRKAIIVSRNLHGFDPVYATGAARVVSENAQGHKVLTFVAKFYPRHRQTDPTWINYPRDNTAPAKILNGEQITLPTDPAAAAVVQRAIDKICGAMVCETHRLIVDTSVDSRDCKYDVRLSTGEVIYTLGHELEQCERLNCECCSMYVGAERAIYLIEKHFALARTAACDINYDRPIYIYPAETTQPIYIYPAETTQPIHIYPAETTPSAGMYKGYASVPRTERGCQRTCPHPNCQSPDCCSRW